MFLEQAVAASSVDEPARADCLFFPGSSLDGNRVASLAALVGVEFDCGHGAIDG